MHGMTSYASFSTKDCQIWKNDQELEKPSEGASKTLWFVEREWLQHDSIQLLHCTYIVTFSNAYHRISPIESIVRNVLISSSWNLLLPMFLTLLICTCLLTTWLCHKAKCFAASIGWPNSTRIQGGVSLSNSILMVFIWKRLILSPDLNMASNMFQAKLPLGQSQNTIVPHSLSYAATSSKLQKLQIYTAWHPWQWCCSHVLVA